MVCINYQGPNLATKPFAPASLKNGGCQPAPRDSPSIHGNRVIPNKDRFNLLLTVCVHQ